METAIRENAGIRESADFREGITSFLEKRKRSGRADERQRLDDR